MWQKCLLSVWWQAEERMLHLLKRGRDLHEWSRVTGPRRCFLVTVDAPSLHKACFIVYTFTGGVRLHDRCGLEV